MSESGILPNDHFTVKACTDVVCVLKATTISSISVLVILGNLLSLIVLGSSPSLRNCHGLLLISLSVADLATGLVASMSVYPAVYQKYLWPYGDTLCLVAASVEAVVRKVSPLTLTLLSIERYIAVVHPLRYNRIFTKKLTVIGLSFCWLFPIVFFFPLLLSRQMAYRHVFLFHSCTITYQNQILFMLLNMFIFTFPSMITVCVTSWLAWRGMKRSSRLRALMAARPGSQAGQSHKAVRFFRMSRIMTFTFFACWAPNVFVGLGCILADVRQPLGVFFALYWLHISNSFWNVVIYFVMNDAFRRRALELVRSPAAALVNVCHARRVARSTEQTETDADGLRVASVTADSHSRLELRRM